MDVSTQIELLTKHGERINEKDFDLEAWKSTATTLITKIFGKDDTRVASIAGLKIDYGSWALRDASSKYDPVATCKRMAHDIMSLSIAELRSQEKQRSDAVSSSLKDQLTGKQFDEINKILESKKSDSDKVKAITTKLKGIKAPTLSEILASIVVAHNGS